MNNLNLDEPQETVLNQINVTGNAGKRAKLPFDAQPPEKLSKGQKFCNQMSQDLGWIPNVVGASFIGIANLVQSIGREMQNLKHNSSKILEKKKLIEGFEEIQATLAEQHYGKIKELVNKKLLTPHEKKGVLAYYKALSDFTIDKGHKYLPNSIENRLEDNPEEAKLHTELKTLALEHRNLGQKIKKEEAGLVELQKSKAGSIASKVIRTGLLAVAAPAVATLTALALAAPTLFIWVPLALVDSAKMAATGTSLHGKQSSDGADAQLHNFPPSEEKTENK
jgi:hypothetical protein